MSEPNNPLAKYFRIPGLNVHLPTGGAFLPPGSVETTVDGAIPVFPMRAADELLLKNPDALLSGYAIEKMLESCIPAIKEPRLISAPDLDLLLLAIRAATYGDMMEVQVGCPECGHVNSFECHLPQLIENTKEFPTDHTVRLSDDLVLDVRPYNFADTTALSLATYQETRKLQALNMDETATEDQRTSHLNQSMQMLTNLNTRLMAGCVLRVSTPTGVVEDRAYIAQFLANIESRWATKIENKLRELNEAGMDKAVTVTCERPTCGHTWNSNIEFDPASFFDLGS